MMKIKLLPRDMSTVTFAMGKSYSTLPAIFPRLFHKHCQNVFLAINTLTFSVSHSNTVCFFKFVV